MPTHRNSVACEAESFLQFVLNGHGTLEEIRQDIGVQTAERRAVRLALDLLWAQCQRKATVKLKPAAAFVLRPREARSYVGSSMLSIIELGDDEAELPATGTGRSGKMTPALVKRARALFSSGMNVACLSRRLGVSPSSIRRWIFQEAPPSCKWCKTQFADWPAVRVHIRSCKKSPVVIAKTMGCSVTTVRRRLGLQDC
jgi:hypothetical protein